MIQNFIAIDAVSIFALLLLELMVFQSEILNAKKRRVFCLAINIIIIAVLSEIGTSLFDNSRPEYATLDLILNIIGFTVSPFIPVIVSEIFDTTEEKRNIILLKHIPAFINAAFVLASPITGSIFSVSKENVYNRGPLFDIFIFSYVIGIIFVIGKAWIVARKFQLNTKTTYVALAGFLLICSSVQLFFTQIHVAWMCVTISLIALYATLCDQNDRLDIQTNLFNRRTFEHEISRLKPNAKGTIILFDVDNFKFINDNYGHMFGDLCLSILAKAVLEQFQDKASCFRFGGDEFCVLCPTDDEQNITELLHNVVHSVEANRRRDNRIPRISFGYKAFTVGPDFDINRVIREADRQMYKYKRKNKNTVK